MARVTPVFRPADYPANVDADTRRELEALFAALAPGQADPAIDPAHAGMAVAALSPGLALQLSGLTTFVATKTAWAKRPELLELAIQTVNLRFGCAFSFEARRPRAITSGLGLERLAALSDWRGSRLFDTEQALILEYVEAAATANVPEQLFAALCDAHGERAAIELTTLVGCFAMWAMLINAAGLTPG